ncbi:SCO family protein [Pseudomonas sp. JM0905a]|uniref:SCO family protein n=1 Tax=Metapseudomonas resinovorans TaxID=53412 RepID=A0ABT4Y9Y9_METRE|nr:MULTISPECIES: SCO family protein [Pseudomonas]MBD2840452.1 SCO family protein [Pseudomonas sp. JM0905a]MDA8485682.1 SCO family protein [Pseudomonas resinovorans]
MNTRRILLGGMGIAALGSALWLALPEAEQSTGRSGATPFPNVTLYNQDGDKLRFYDDLIRNKVVALNMMYVMCEGICPTMTSNLRKLQSLLGKRMGRDVFMCSISLQPEMDSPEVLKAYAAKHRVLPGWQFLTGSPDDIRRVRFSMGFYDPVPEVDANLATHTGMVRIGNDATKRWTMAPALCDAERIITTINHVDRRMVETAYPHDRRAS